MGEVTILSDLAKISGGQVGYAALALATAGTISMMTLEVIKALTPLREAFQRKWFANWTAGRRHELDKELVATLQPKAEELREECPKCAWRQCVHDSLDQLVELATGGDVSALFSLEPEDMVPQMNLAAQIALDDSARYRCLLIVLTSGLSLEDFNEISPSGKSEGAITTRYMTSRERAARRIQRNLDGVRLSMGNRWRWWLQITSIALTVLIIEIAEGAVQADLSNYFLAIPVGIVGGYLAPITRDLLAALQQLRDP